MPQPNKIPLAFAASGDKNAIPESTETTGLASWREGFPAITSAPFSEGGTAPKRADFNGIFYALSLATLWQQQGGFYAYDATTDYEVGNVVVYNNDLYKCLAANGPSSAVKAPTDATGWAKVILTTATTTAAGYMSAADKAAVDSIPGLGTYNRMFFSQTSGTYTAPRTGWYRITLKGGGGGGAGASGKTPGGGGGEGGTVIFYASLIKLTSYSYTIGAGGTAGALDTNGGDGGTSSMIVDGVTYVAYGGTGGRASQSFAGAVGGSGAPASAYIIQGAPGQTPLNNISSVAGNYFIGASGGGNGGGTSFANGSPGTRGGGGGGGPYLRTTSREGGAGGDGYILIEYAG